MSQGGFFEQKRASPTGFLLVVAGHLALIGAVMLAKGPEFIRITFPPMIVKNIPLPQDPPPERQVEPRPSRAQQASRIETVPPVVERTSVGPVVTGERTPDIPPLVDRVGPEVLPPPPPPAADPVRREAEFDARYAANVQPPYPASEQRAEREGTVRIRVTIGTDGRVRSAERLSATSDAFWRSAERHVLSNWRFRPATVDGRPVESTRTMTLYFRLT